MKTTFLQPLRTVALLALLWALPQSHASAQEFEVDGIWYSVLSEGGVKVIPNPDKSVYSFSEVVLPDTVLYEATGYAVTEIGDTAFYQCADLAAVTIPKSVTNVASKAFYKCSGLRYVKIADGSTPLSFTDNYQFWTSPLDSAYIGRDLEYGSGRKYGGNSPFLGMSNLQFTPIKKVEFGDSVTVVGERLFENSASLENIIFGDNVTEILNTAFRNCTALTVLEFPASVKTIKSAFNGCDNISRVVCLAETPPTVSGGFPTEATLFVPEGCLETYQNAKVWKLFAKIIDAPYIPDFMADGIKYSLVGKGKVGVVAINDTTKYVGDITLPETVVHEGVTFTLTTICRGAFNQCTELNSVQIPATVNSIEGTAFANSGLVSIGLPKSLTNIAAETFAYCQNLSSIVLPDSLTTLGKSAFLSCSNLRRIVIPANVEYIGSGAFSGCGIDTMIVKSMTPPIVISSDALGNYYENYGTLVVPTGLLETYMNAQYWQDFYKIEEEGGYSNVFEVDGVSYKISSLESASVTVIGASGIEIIIPGSVMYDKEYSVTAIADEAFDGNHTLESIVISEGVVTLGSYAFRDCVNLSSITIPSTLVNGNFSYQYNDYNRNYAPAFYGCTGLESITVAEGHPHLDSRNACNALIWTNEGWNGVELMMGCKNTVIPDGVTQVAPYAFAWTTVDKVVIPNSVTRIGTQAFQGCGSLTTLYIGSGLTEFDYYGVGYNNELSEQIQNSLHPGPNNLETIVVDEENPLIDSRNGCNAIIETATNTLVLASNRAIIPEDVTEIAVGAFQSCRKLESIYIPASLTTIPWGAFDMCFNLESIVVDEANPVYDSRNNCNAIIETATETLVRGCKTTVIPEDVVFIGHYAFSGCYGLEEIVIPDAVHSIGKGAFGSCSHLRTITFGSGVKSISSLPFGDMSFAFRPTMPLNTIVFKGAVPPAFVEAYGAFSETMKSYVQLLVPEGALAAYQSAEVWKDFAHITESEGAVEFESDGICYRIIIGNDSAMVRPRLDKESAAMVSTYPDSIVIPETVWYENKEYVVNAIGEYAFYGCGLRYLSIPATVKEIGYDGLAAFFNGTVVCYATIPPQCFNHTSLGVSHDAVLRVPKASLELYEQAYWWKSFWIYNTKIEAIEDAAGIESVEVGIPEPQPDAVYDLSGRRITDVGNLKSGIYIVNGRKIVIR